MVSAKKIEYSGSILNNIQGNAARYARVLLVRFPVLLSPIRTHTLFEKVRLTHSIESQMCLFAWPYSGQEPVIS